MPDLTGETLRNLIFPSSGKRLGAQNGKLQYVSIA